MHASDDDVPAAEIENAQRNRAVYGRSAAWYGQLHGLSDAGEGAALHWLAVREICGSVLDLGVGGGRTVDLLRPYALSYLGIDIEPCMIETARQQYQDVDLQVGDARTLAGIPDASVDLVVFSFNGIDAVAHADRMAVLQSVHRVLRPGGVFWFSTLNRAGPLHRRRPWWPGSPGETGGWRHYPRVVADALAALPQGLRNYLRSRRGTIHGDGWEVTALDAHRFGMSAHYTTLQHEIDELAACGFQPLPQVFGNDGVAIDNPAADLRHVSYFHILAFR